MDEKVLKHVVQRSKEWGIPLPSNVQDILANIEDSFQEKGILLRFSEGRGLSSDKLGANAGLFRSSFIMLTPEWAAYLVLKNSDVVQNAFLSTVGHEMTHKEGKDINPFRHLLNIKFVAWTNEVHADFGAKNKMLQNSHARLISALKFKLSQKVNDCEDCSHPSWKRRIHYAENFETFDEKLIRQIAKDARCKNKKLIQKVIDHYTK